MWRTLQSPGCPCICWRFNHFTCLANWFGSLMATKMSCLCKRHFRWEWSEKSATGWVWVRQSKYDRFLIPRKHPWPIKTTQTLSNKLKGNVCITSLLHCWEMPNNSEWDAHPNIINIPPKVHRWQYSIGFSNSYPNIGNSINCDQTPFVCGECLVALKPHSAMGLDLWSNFQ